MSEPQRDESSGQFTSASAEPLTGQAGVEHDQGYVPMPTIEPQDAAEPVSDIKAEAERLAASRTAEDPITNLEYQRLSDGSPVPKNETITLEKAVKDASEFHSAQAQVARATDDGDIAKYVDGLRAQALAGENPQEAAKHLGLSKEEVALAKSVEAEAAIDPTAPQATEVSSEVDPYSDIEGLDEPTRQAMKVPQIREAVEKEFNKASEIQTAYSAALQNGQQMMRASIAALAPQLDSIPLENWIPAIQAISQQDPVRGKLIVDTLQNWSKIQQHEELQKHHNAQVQYDRFAAFVKGEDARTDQLAKAEGIEVSNHKIVSYWERAGVPRNQFVAFCQANPAAASAEARIMALKADRYDEMMRSPKPHATRDLPPVTKPGFSTAARGNSNASAIRALEKQLDGATSHAAIKIAAKLQSLKRA